MSGTEDALRDSIRAFNEADWDGLAALWDPEGTVVAPTAWPEGGTVEGWPAIRAQFERLKADWEEDHIVVEGVEEARPEVVLAQLRWTVTGAASGVSLEVPMWMVATIRDGRCVHAEFFQEEQPARAAA